MYTVKISRIPCKGYTVINEKELPKEVARWVWPAIDRNRQPILSDFESEGYRQVKDVGEFGNFVKKYQITVETVKDVEQFGCYHFTLKVTPIGLNRFWEK